MPSLEWTNPSVKKLAGASDPTEIIIHKTRSFILKLLDDGWQGPPFDVFNLARRLGFSVIPKEDVTDARLITNDDKIEIQYNPNRPNNRIRFSIAHEIAHTFFPDYFEEIRNRSTVSQRKDEWQLELLCNIAASEILMPVGPSFDSDKLSVTIDNAILVHKKFDVSMEAALLRLGKLTTQPVTLFAAARENDEPISNFRIDYVINPAATEINLTAGMVIPYESVLSECTAVGYTRKKHERWSKDLPEIYVECVGVPPYPNHTYPRVLGIIRSKERQGLRRPGITYVNGDATVPSGEGCKIIAHIVSDSTINWTRGFASEVARKWPNVAADYRKWVGVNPNNRQLGNSRFFEIESGLAVFHMIAQRGYGFSDQPRIRYQNLRQCLDSLAQVACDYRASVHMPRIGTGFAGGNWSVISEMIDEALVSRGIDVTVYTLPRESANYLCKLSDFNNPLNGW